VIIVTRDQGAPVLETRLLDPDWPAEERAEDMGEVRWG
jgi:hypothetical protein